MNDAAAAPDTDQHNDQPWHGCGAPSATTQQIPAVGAPAGIEYLLVGSVLWAVPDRAAGVLELVADGDISNPHLAVVLAALREMVTNCLHFSPQLVMDRLTRQGVHRPVLAALIDATTSGAATEACRDYAAAVVAASLRRRTESGGAALSSAADEAAEADIPLIATAIAERLNTTAHQLAQLRGDA